MTLVLALGRRLAGSAAALVLLSAVAFALPRVAAGDPTATAYGTEATTADRAALRAQLGLDQPLLTQYVNWMGGALRGDLGRSFRTNEPVLTVIASRFPATGILALAATALAALAGIALGTVATLARWRWLRTGASALAAAAGAAPGFWVGMLALYIFSYQLGWLPYGGYIAGNGPGFAGFDLSRLLLPALALATRETGRAALLVQTGLTEALAQPYARVAAAKGLSSLAVGLRHALPNALAPLLASVGVSIVFLAGGAVAVESVFGWPGVGRLMAEAASSRDLPMLAAGILTVGVATTAINLAVDLGSAWADPRWRGHTPDASAAGDSF